MLDIFASRSALELALASVITEGVSRFRICPGAAPSTMVKILALAEYLAIKAQSHRSIGALGSNSAAVPLRPLGGGGFSLSTHKGRAN